MVDGNLSDYNFREDRTSMIKFVEIVQRYPEIYDSTMEQYKSKWYTDQAWDLVNKAIKDELNLESSIWELKTKWKGIRSSYNRFKKALIRETQIRSKTPLRKYYLYDHLRFLEPFTDHVVKRTTDRETSTNTTGSGSNLVAVSLIGLVNKGVADTQTSTDMADSDSNTERLPVSFIDCGSKRVAETQSNSENMPAIENTTEYIPIYNLQSTSTDFGHASASNESNALKCEDIEIKEEIIKQEESSLDSDIEQEGPLRTETDDSDLQFFRCILPDIAHFSPAEKRKLKVGIFKLIDEIESERSSCNNLPVL